MMDSGQPLPFDRAAASNYLKQAAASAPNQNDKELLSVNMANDLLVIEDEKPVAFNRSTASTNQKENTVAIAVSIGNGSGTGTAWGCDLSYDYVKINAEYTT